MKSYEETVGAILAIEPAIQFPQMHLIQRLLEEGVTPRVILGSRAQARVDDPPALKAAVQTLTGSRFVLGKASLKELEGVHPPLVECVKQAIQLSTQDFTVYDGLRTYKEQLAHVKNGTSRTMESKHLKGEAVDLVPWINGKPTWDWEGCYKIAFAMDAAATIMGIANRITWGAAWDRRLSDFGGRLEDYKAEAEAYAKRHPGKDFLDGPHFEWRG